MEHKVFVDIEKERERQDVKWGLRNHDPFTWLAILGEEKGEADKAALEHRYSDAPASDYRKELVETAAVAVAAVECYDRHAPGSGQVYLAGPIKSCTPGEVHDWREDAELLLRPVAKNPAKARDFSQRECKDCMNEIVNPDKNDIDGCAIVLAHCWQVSVGTSMEILYGWERGKIIVTIVPTEGMLSAWIIAHSHAMFYSLEDACEYINGLAADWKQGGGCA